MNIVKVSKEEFVVAILNEQKRRRIERAKREDEMFIEYKKAKSQRLKRYM